MDRVSGAPMRNAKRFLREKTSFSGTKNASMDDLALHVRNLLMFVAVMMSEANKRAEAQSLATPQLSCQIRVQQRAVPS